MNGFLILETSITNTLLSFSFQFFRHNQQLKYLNFSKLYTLLYTLLISTLSQPHNIISTLKNSLGWMSNTSHSPNNHSQTQHVCLHIIFSIARKYHTIAELLKVFSSVFLDLIYQHNVLPPDSPFAAIRYIKPTLILFIIDVPVFTNCKFYYCNNFLTLGPNLTAQFRPLINNPTLSQIFPRYPKHLVAHTVKQINNPLPKSHHLNSLRNNHKHKRPKNTHTQSLLLPNLQIDLVLLDTPPILPHNQ